MDTLQVIIAGEYTSLMSFALELLERGCACPWVSNPYPTGNGVLQVGIPPDRLVWLRQRAHYFGFTTKRSYTKPDKFLKRWTINHLRLLPNAVPCTIRPLTISPTEKWGWFADSYDLSLARQLTAQFVAPLYVFADHSTPLVYVPAMPVLKRRFARAGIPFHSAFGVPDLPIVTRVSVWEDHLWRVYPIHHEQNIYTLSAASHNVFVTRRNTRSRTADTVLWDHTLAESQESA